MRIGSVALIASLFGAAGCSGTATGTGTDLSGTSGGTSGSGTSGSGTSGSGTSGGTSGAVTDPATATYDALFGPPTTSTVTANSLQGVWAGNGTYGDVRLKISGTSILVAVRCTNSSGGPSTIGLEMAVRLSNKSIQILESKATPQTSNSYCSIDVRPADLAACGPDAYSYYNCFRLNGTQLDIGSSLALWTTAGGSRGHNDLFTKLSD